MEDWDWEGISWTVAVSTRPEAQGLGGILVTRDYFYSGSADGSYKEAIENMSSFHIRLFFIATHGNLNTLV